MAEPLLTIKDLRDRLGCSRDTAYQLVASGSLPSIRLGAGSRVIRIRPETLAAWELAQEQAHENESAERGTHSSSALNGGRRERGNPYQQL